MSNEINPILVPAHLSSCPLNQNQRGSEQGAEIWNSRASTVRINFPPCWAEARRITWMEKILQMGQMCQSPSGGAPRPHGWHCHPFFIWKAWHPVRVPTPRLAMQPGLETATAGEGEGRLFLFLATRRLSPTSPRPAHPRCHLRNRAGRPQPAVLHPSDVPENLSPRLSIGPRSEVGSVSQSSGFCWKWETQTSW